MIKGITKSPIIRNLAIGAMFAGAVAAGQATKPVTNPQTERPMQEQLMSKDASKALLALTLSQTPSFERNRAIDNKVMELSTTEKDKKENAEAMTSYYKSLGTNGAVMVLQGMLCDYCFEKTIDEFHKKETAALRKQLENPTKEQKDEYWHDMVMQAKVGKISIADYYCERLDASVQNLKKYYKESWAPHRITYLNNAIKAGNGKPSAKIASDYMDRLERSINSFTEEEHKAYKNGVAEYEAKLGNSAIDQSNLVAFKMFLIDKLIIMKNAKDFPMIKNSKTFNSIFKKSFEQKLYPQPEKASRTPSFGLA